MKAQDSYRERSRNDKRKVKRFKSPDVSKMPGFKVPNPNVVGKWTYFFFKTKRRRNEMFHKYDGSVKIDPK